LVLTARSTGRAFSTCSPCLGKAEWRAGGLFSSGSCKALEHQKERGQCAGSCSTVGKLQAKIMGGVSSWLLNIKVMWLGDSMRIRSHNFKPTAVCTSSIL